MHDRDTTGGEIGCQNILVHNPAKNGMIRETMSQSGARDPQAAATLYRGGPGAGKTALLVRQAHEVLRQGTSAGRVLCLALDGSGVDLLQRRFLQAVISGDCAGLPQVLTYEQIGRRILDEAYGGAAGRFLDPLTERLLVGRALQDTSSAARYFRAPELRSSPRFRDDVADFIAELKRHKLSPERFRDEIIPGLPDQNALADIAEAYQRYQQLVQEAGVYDMRGLLWLALIALEQEPDLAASWRQRFDLILSDDLQDATALHLELLAALTGPETELIAAHEPAQAIYRFRGAVPNPGTLLALLLADRPLKQERLPAARGALPDSVAEAGQRFAESHTLQTEPPGRSGGPGEIGYALYRSPESELASIGNAIIQALEQERFAPQEIAVITRSTKDAQAAAEYLARRDIPVAGDEGEPGHWQARQMLSDLLRVVTEQRDEELAPAPEGAAGEALCRLADLVAGEPEQLALPKLAGEDVDLLRDPMPEGYPALASLRELLDTSRQQSLVEAMCKLSQHLLAQMTPQRRELLEGPVTALLGQLAQGDDRLGRLTGASLGPAEIQTVLAEARLRPAFECPAVSVLTAHQSRGRRFRLALVAALQEETFPAPPVTSQLLSPTTVEKLRDKVQVVLDLPPGVLSFAGIGEAPQEAWEEEQRLFLTCLTRSSERLVLSCHLEAAGAPLLPSPYLAAVLPTDFVLREGSVADREFDCIFAGLAPEGRSGRLTHDGCPVHPCHHAQPEAPPPPRPAIHKPSSLSQRPVLTDSAESLVVYPSHLSEYLLCPRRYFLAHLLKVELEEDKDHFTYGSVVHKFLQRLNELEPQARNEAMSFQLLEETFAERRDDFSSSLAARVYLELAQQVLAVYLQTETAQQVTLTTEQRLQFEIQDPQGPVHRFGGKLDAAFVVEGGAMVVDYKTGKLKAVGTLAESIPRQPSEVREGKREVQLPMYALAWKAQSELPPLRQICLHGFRLDNKCRRYCIDMDTGDQPELTLTREHLADFQQLLVRWAREIKSAAGFAGEPPEEGCRPFMGACPFAEICDEAELF